MKTVAIKNYNTPEVMVRLFGLKINSNDLTFTASLQMSKNGVIWSEEEKLIGKCTIEVKDWISKRLPEKAKVAANNEQGFEWLPTGRYLTKFQHYLEAIGFERYVNDRDILCDIVFESDNRSDNRQANPFRIVKRLDGICTLTMVNIPSKKRTVYVNEETGEETVNYKTKYGKFADGKVVKAFIRPAEYRRFIFEEMVQRELYQEPATQEENSDK